jgi:hypothetical protein
MSLRDREITVIKLFDAQTILASGNSSQPGEGIDLQRYAQNGFFSVQYLITGDGTAKIEYNLSHDGATYIEPTSATDIGSSLTKTTGPGSDGKDILTFSPELSRFLKIKVTETGGAQSIIVTLWLAIQ